MKKKSIGSGSYGETYIATLMEDQAQVFACKMITKKSIMEKLQTSSNPEKRREYIITSLRNEVELWKKLDHFNIV